MSLSITPYCPRNYIIRDSYKTKSGFCSQSRCVRKTGLLKGKSSVRTKRLLKKANNLSNYALMMSKKRGLTINSKCRKNQTLRRGYSRRSYNRKIGTHVMSSIIAPGCISKRGKIISYTRKHNSNNSNNSNKIILDPKDHYLSEYGYFDVVNKTKEERHSALHKLISHFITINGYIATYNYVIKALNARYVLNKYSNPKTANIFKTDQRIISKEYKMKMYKLHKNTLKHKHSM